MSSTTPTPDLTDSQACEFHVCESLQKIGCRHCVSLFILENKQNPSPAPQHGNATMTLIEYKGRHYGITCAHVMRQVDILNREAKSYLYDVFSVVGQLVLLARHRFVQPEVDISLGLSPDIAIRELKPEYIKQIGKEPLRFSQPPVEAMTYGVAVGYPTDIKKSAGNGGVTIPCVHALADIVSLTERKVILFSVLGNDPGIDSFSGMSGGPIYWTGSTDYGLLGITFEAAPPRQAGLIADHRIYILGEVLTEQRLDLWLSQIPKLFS